jgi:cell division protein FtsB
MSMSFGRRLRRQAQGLLLPGVLFLFAAYFGWQATQGSRGLHAYAQRQKEEKAARAELDAARAEASAQAESLRARMADLEAQNAKHEERVVKAYQKIKGDEKMREKARKALAIALQLLEDRPAAAPIASAGEVAPRRE